MRIINFVLVVILFSLIGCSGNSSPPILPSISLDDTMSHYAQYPAPLLPFLASVTEEIEQSNQTNLCVELHTLKLIGLHEDNTEFIVRLGENTFIAVDGLKQQSSPPMQFTALFIELL